jgi:fructose transport system substrate-binding protein
MITRTRTGRAGHRGYLGAAAGIAALSLVLTACSSSTSGSESSAAASAAGSAAGSAAASAPAEDKGHIAVIVKTLDNPFYNAIIEAAKAQGASMGYSVIASAGSGQTDGDSQVKNIEDSISQGVKGILIAPTGPEVGPTIKKAREAGIPVIVLDSILPPEIPVDASFATENRQAGELIGQWAKAKLAAEGKEPKMVTLDLSVDQIPVDVARNQGFLKGMGVDLKDPDVMWDESDPRLLGNEVTAANEEGGLKGMEKLIQRFPDINLVYTINEPTAVGAYSALKAAGKEKDVVIVSVDGGCVGVQNAKDGVIGATSMQFPALMGSEGVKAVDAIANGGQAPAPSEGLNYTNTGVQLITDDPQTGVESQDTTFGLEKCWG